MAASLDFACFRLRSANTRATIAPTKAAPSTPPTAPPTVAELSAGHSDLSMRFALGAVDAHVLLSVNDALATSEASVVELKVVFTIEAVLGKRRLPMCEVDMMVRLLLQQFSVSDAARQQNLPGSHCKTL